MNSIPSTGRSGLAPVVNLFLATVADVAIEDRGTLKLDFGGGSGLTVNPHDQYESWHLQGHGIQGIDVGLGGEVGWQE